MFVNFIEEIHVIESIDQVVHSLVKYNSGLPFIPFTFYKKSSTVTPPFHSSDYSAVNIYVTHIVR